ncbi:hypothetical protein L3X38_013486 [Prunus dulcis]|uniref:Uncharacterized protein n=1 Tax=Prunus dulcis TaxID=3755 RepID=A0AAD4ZH27_PRUDU|nr:hypothetical protein L3X38_013486 [Prunus dulcis]
MLARFSFSNPSPARPDPPTPSVFLVGAPPSPPKRRRTPVPVAGKLGHDSRWNSREKWSLSANVESILRDFGVPSWFEKKILN